MHGTGASTIYYYRYSLIIDILSRQIAALTGLSSLSDISVADVQPSLDTIARLGEEVPAKALRNCISLSLGGLPDLFWKRCPGRPRGRWIDQLRRDNSQPPADLWRQAINRGHSGRATQRSSDYATTWPDLTVWYIVILSIPRYPRPRHEQDWTGPIHFSLQDPAPWPRTR